MSNENKPLPLRVDISPSLRPELMDRHSEVLKGKENVLAAAKNAMTGFHKEIALIKDAKAAAVAGNPAFSIRPRNGRASQPNIRARRKRRG